MARYITATAKKDMFLDLKPPVYTLHREKQRNQNLIRNQSSKNQDHQKKPDISQNLENQNQMQSAY